MLPLYILALGGASIKMFQELRASKRRSQARSQPKPSAGLSSEARVMSTAAAPEAEARCAPMASGPDYLQAQSRFSFSSKLLAGTVFCTVVNPSLMLLLLPVLFFDGLPVYRRALKDLAEGKLSHHVVGAALSLGVIAYTPFRYSILTVGTFARWLYSYGRMEAEYFREMSDHHFQHLLGPLPRRTWRLIEEGEFEVARESVRLGDRIVFEPGDKVWFDGKVVEGQGLVDRGLLTGSCEATPVGIGDGVLAGTIVRSGRVVIGVERMGADTVISRMGQVLSASRMFTPDLSVQADVMHQEMIGPSLLLSGVALPMVGPSYALSILASQIGYNLRILGPVAVSNFLELALDKGILVRQGNALDQLAELETVILELRCLTLADGSLRYDAVEVIRALRRAGLRVAVITPLERTNAMALGKQLGVNIVFAEASGKEVAAWIRKERERGIRVGYVALAGGSPALHGAANLSISMGGPESLDLDDAQILLLNQHLSTLPLVFALGREWRACMSRNLTSSVTPGVMIIGGAMVGLVKYRYSAVILCVGMLLGGLNTMKVRLWLRPQSMRRIHRVGIFPRRSRAKRGDTSDYVSQGPLW